MDSIFLKKIFFDVFKKKKSKKNLLCWLILFGGSAWGQTPLTLEQSVERALQQNIDVQKKAIDLATTGYAANHLWSEVFPTISGSLGVGYGSALFTGDGFKHEDKNLTYSMSLGVNLSLNAGLPYTMKMISLAYQTSLLTYENARRQLEIQVSKSFYSLAAEQDRLALLRETLDLAEKQRERSRISFQNGIIPQRDYLQSQLSTETAKLALSKAQSSYAAALREFLTLLGLDNSAEVTLIGSIEISRISADPETLILTYLAKRPDIISQRQTIERLEYTQSRTTLTNRGPSLSVSAQWSGSGNADKSSTFTDNLRGSVSVSIPIDSWIPGTKNYQSIKTAGAEVEKAKLDLQNTENTAKNQIRSLIANLENFWSTIEIDELRVSIADETFKLTEQAFQRGAAEFLTLEDARNKLTEARQQLLADKLSYKQALLDLAGALNLSWEEFS
ncbi:MAG: TolC family protein, partial [Spirochaetaceae bacterium]|nr:TolC family protein [Spirochaetaceae bacterium]